MNKQLSFWERQYYYANIDFTIVGAGLVGLSTAYFLKKKHPKAKIVILERDFPGYGASTRNAGFACFGSASEILSDLEAMSEAALIDLIKLRWDGLKLLKTIVDPKLMEYSAYGAEEVFDQSDQRSFDNCLDNLEHLNSLVAHAIGIKQVFAVKANTSFPKLYNQCIGNAYEGQLNPMLMIAGLSAKVREMGVNIIYNAKVTQIRSSEKMIALEKVGTVDYKKLIVCTNGFAKTLLPELRDLKTVRNQVLMTEEIPQLAIKGTFHMDQGYVYFRNYKNRILLGGARNLDLEGETTDLMGTNPRILAHLKDFLYNKLLVDKKVAISDQWSGILGVGGQKSPIVKAMSDDTYVGIRMGGMGVAIGSAIGQKLAAIID